MVECEWRRALVTKETSFVAHSRPVVDEIVPTYEACAGGVLDYTLGMQQKPLKAYANVGLMRLARRFRSSTNPARPVVAYAEPTLYCNLGCPACPTGLKLDVRPRVAMEFEWYRRVLDELGPYLFFLNLYNWGEPLLHKQFPEMVAYAKQWDIRVIASSNLSLPLEREYLERLVRSGLDKLKVGMEGTSQEEYARYRVRGNFDLVTGNMRTIQEIKRELGLRTPKILIGFHVFEHNQHSVQEARRRYREWGADGISFAASFVSEQAEQQGIRPSTIDAFNLYRAAGLETSREPCSWLWGAIVANPSGSISPCCGVVDERSDFVRDARGKSIFGTVWNNAVYRRARRITAKPRAHGGRRVHLPRDGMQLSSIPTRERELICERCPIPFRQDYVDRMVDKVANDVITQMRHGKRLRIRLRASLAFVLMGMPKGKRRRARADDAQPPEPRDTERERLLLTGAGGASGRP
ncbi:MAG: radical SAM protein [Acidobacteria bacterium]|nr:radical SAM protein [Acidobacteriota bacterium]